MKEDEALMLFSRILPFDETEQTVAQILLQELGFLPLAIVHVATWLTAQRETTISTYLETLRAEFEALSAQEDSDRLAENPKLVTQQLDNSNGRDEDEMFAAAVDTFGRPPLRKGGPQYVSRHVCMGSLLDYARLQVSVSCATNKPQKIFQTWVICSCRSSIIRGTRSSGCIVLSTHSIFQQPGRGAQDFGANRTQEVPFKISSLQHCMTEN